MGIRPHHLTLKAKHPAAVKVTARVQVAEISGSESVIHVDVHGNNWVSESHGVHPAKVGDDAEVYINVQRCLYFSSNGDLINASETRHVCD